MLSNVQDRIVAGLAQAQRSTGQTLAEYSLILTIVALGIALLSVIAFRNELAGAFNSIRNCLDGVC